MKFFRMLRRSIRDAFKSVFRNFSLSLASISCITITLIIVAVSIIVTFNVQNFTKEMEKDLTIVVFLDTDTTEEEVEEIRDKLESMSNVESLTYQSKASVKEEMRVDTCSACHPFFTGQKQAISNKGRAAKFMEKYGLNQK